MSFKSTVRNVGDVTVLDLEGRIVLGQGSGELRNSIKELLAAGKDKILINLAGVNYIDSSGLGELVAAYGSVMNARGQVKLENVQTKVRDLLQITKLNSVFETFTEEAKAVSSFRAAAATA
jgi:anti-sigma B factor antagonist